jgi:methionine synthase I (cobalamin-dependent)
MELRFPFILDGATGTEIQKRGYDGSTSSEEWALANPEKMAQLQKGYVEAGSNAVYAPTFGANRIKLEEHGVKNQVAEFNKILANISKEAVGDKALVAGDIAPTGKILYPLGDIHFEELYEIYCEQVKALEESDVDLYVIETMMTLAEARAAVLAVKHFSNKPIFVTFTCDETGRTLTGSDVVAILQVMQGMGIDAFGLNCSVGPDQMLIQLKRLQEVSRIPLIAKPNAGLPIIVDGETVYPASPEEFTEYIPALAQAGVEIFGGCCGTRKEHIAAIKASLADVKMQAPSPKNTDKLPAATGSDFFFLEPTAGYDHVLACDADLEDKIEDEADFDCPLTAVKIVREDELVHFEEAQTMIKKPLCILCDDVRLLEKALRLYQGRALYEGALAEEVLLPLVEKYGLII